MVAGLPFSFWLSSWAFEYAPGSASTTTSGRGIRPRVLIAYTIVGIKSDFVELVSLYEVKVS